MVKIKLKPVVKIDMAGEAVTASQTLITTAEHSYLIDEPASRGGTGKGLSPTETFIAALVGCTNRITQKVAKLHGVAYTSLNTKAETEVDIRGAFLQEEIDRPFKRIRLTITMATDADEAALALVKRDLPRYCPISKLVQASGTELIEDWVFEAP
jgi:uncharacterized OsmC-like protein